MQSYQNIRIQISKSDRTLRRFFLGSALQMTKLKCLETCDYGLILQTETDLSIYFSRMQINEQMHTLKKLKIKTLTDGKSLITHVREILKQPIFPKFVIIDCIHLFLIGLDLEKRLQSFELILKYISETFKSKNPDFPLLLFFNLNAGNALNPNSEAEKFHKILMNFKGLDVLRLDDKDENEIEVNKVEYGQNQQKYVPLVINFEPIFSVEIKEINDQIRKNLKK